MSTARLDVLVSAVAADAGLDPDRVTQHRTEIIRWINETRREIYELPTRLQALEFKGEISTVANITAGTVATTQDLAEITGSSTAWATAMAGRYISIGSAPWQRISFVTDTTHLTLESPWPDSAVSSQSYKIWKRDYALPAKVEKVEEIVPMDDPDNSLGFCDPDEFQARNGFADQFGTPRTYTQYGSQEHFTGFLGATIYVNVTSTANSPIVDFAAGAGIVTGIAPGDRLILGSATTSTAFVVDRVLTDTKLALRTYCAVSTGGTSATAQSVGNRLVVNFWNAVNDARIFLYRARRAYADLIVNSDVLEPGWYMAVKKGAVAKAMGFVGSPREGTKMAEYQAEVSTLVRNQFKAFNPSSRLKPHIQGRYTGHMGTYQRDRDDGT